MTDTPKANGVWHQRQNFENPTEQTVKRRAKRCLTTCPHCHAPATIRNNEPVNELHRDIYLICTNHECGHSWKAQLSFVHSIAVPTVTRIDLPISTATRRSIEQRASHPPTAPPVAPLTTDQPA